jgi:hypothetical protein
MTPEIKQAPVPVRHRWVYSDGEVGKWTEDRLIAERIRHMQDYGWHFANDWLTVELSNGQRINVRAK